MSPIGQPPFLHNPCRQMHVKLEESITALQEEIAELRKEIMPLKLVYPAPHPRNVPGMQDKAAAAAARRVFKMDENGFWIDLPRTREDFPVPDDVKLFWTEHEWNNNQPLSTEVGQTKQKGGGTRMADNENVRERYIVNTNGEPVDGFTAKAIRESFYTYCAHLESKYGGFDKLPATWQRKLHPSDFIDYFAFIRAKHPELQICLQNWKARKLAVREYPQWRKRRIEVIHREQKPVSKKRKRKAHSRRQTEAPVDCKSEDQKTNGDFYDNANELEEDIIQPEENSQGSDEFMNNNDDNEEDIDYNDGEEQDHDQPGIAWNEEHAVRSTTQQRSIDLEGAPYRISPAPDQPVPTTPHALPDVEETDDLHSQPSKRPRISSPPPITESSLSDSNDGLVQPAPLLLMPSALASSFPPTGGKPLPESPVVPNAVNHPPVPPGGFPPPARTVKNQTKGKKRTGTATQAAPKTTVAMAPPTHTTTATASTASTSSRGPTDVIGAQEAASMTRNGSTQYANDLMTNTPSASTSGHCGTSTVAAGTRLPAPPFDKSTALTTCQELDTSQAVPRDTPREDIPREDCMDVDTSGGAAGPSQSASAPPQPAPPVPVQSAAQTPMQVAAALMALAGTAPLRSSMKNVSASSKKASSSSKFVWPPVPAEGAKLRDQCAVLWYNTHHGSHEEFDTFYKSMKHPQRTKWRDSAVCNQIALQPERRVGHGALGCRAGVARREVQARRETDARQVRGGRRARGTIRARTMGRKAVATGGAQTTGRKGWGADDGARDAGDGAQGAGDGAHGGGDTRGEGGWNGPIAVWSFPCPVPSA
ncbi:uncharacterized protein BXZ73DRAFT_81941 [Epithele typhae]|uniref:uncharacterized protein n=1 Tax=Epithele typhae TaxID=378194 RepID=UPI002008A83D|nr:uncharacterized protein BXZ73DRAFT_81941 [Epithele typhae]KAH9913481.1 hypothetical protein BXZ73DRAFT_81941 [Epithele typhae]